MKKDPRSIIRNYFPEAVADEVYDSIIAHKVYVRFTGERKSKLGDFRPANAGKPHRISLNNNLNRFEMLITWIHELAHLVTFEEYGTRHLPHGDEWKKNFARLMKPVMGRGVFPLEIEKEIDHFVFVTKASGSELKLKRLLRAYDPARDDNNVTIETITEGSCFRTHDGRIFIKGERLRKRFKCECLTDKRFYLFSPLCMIEPIEKENTFLSLYLTKKIS